MPSPEKHRSISAPPPLDGHGGESHHHHGYYQQHRPHESSYINPIETKKVRSSKGISIQVHFLDESTTGFRVQFKALGKWLFEQVCQMLNLIETDYFGLEYFDINGSRYWLDMEKPIYRQLSLDLNSPIMYFGVKFYSPDPSKLEDELTRYLFSLQIKKDLAQGSLQCNENTAALIASYVVQAEIGDYCPEEYPDQSYLSQFTLVPHQDSAFEWKTMENHKRHIGQSPAEADLNLLETGRRCEYYGVKLTSVKDHEGVPLNLAVTHVGIVVFQNFAKASSFTWARIRKLSFKRKKFLVKLHHEESGADAVEFSFETRNECKNLWKKCIEQHTFFRCTETKVIEKAKAKLFSRGSSFRYSGRTQQQLADYVRQSIAKRQPFQRSSSFRASSSTGKRIEGSAVSIQPILPISTPNLDNIESCTGSELMAKNTHQRSQSAQDYRRDSVRRHGDGTSLASPTSSRHENITGWQSSGDNAVPSEKDTSLECLDQEMEDISHVSYSVAREDEHSTRKSNLIADASVDDASLDALLDDKKDVTDELKKSEDNNLKLGDEDKKDCQPSPDVSYRMREPVTKTEKVITDQTQQNRGRSRTTKEHQRVKQSGDQSSQPQHIGHRKREYKLNPVLYARAKRLGKPSSPSTGSQIAPYNKNQIHYVSLHSLPGLKSFSYHDDTLSDPYDELINKKVEKLKENKSRRASSVKASSKGSFRRNRGSDFLTRDSPSKSVLDVTMKETVLGSTFSASADLIDLDMDYETDFESMELIPSEESLQFEYNLIEASARTRRAINSQIIESNLKEHLPDDMDRDEVSESAALFSPEQTAKEDEEEGEIIEERNDRQATIELPVYSTPSTPRSFRQKSVPGSGPLTACERVGPVLKELLCLERTFHKDLEIINAWFKEEDMDVEPGNLPADVLSLLFSAIDPLLELHNSYLHNLEMKVNSWSLPTNESQFGFNDFKDFVNPLIEALPLYDTLIERLPYIIERFNASFRLNRQFERICREFEARRGCYLPFTSFLTKPGYHVTSFLGIFENLLRFVEDPDDQAESTDILDQVKEYHRDTEVTLNSILNAVYFIELQRDIVGMNTIFQRERKFVRQGCLQKLSKKGYQQRIFFLFNDLLVYCSRSSAANQFKINGTLELENVMIEETEPRAGAQFGFTIYGGDRALMVAANSDKERQIWVRDIHAASAIKADRATPLTESSMFADELLEKIDRIIEDGQSNGDAGSVRSSVGRAGGDNDESTNPSLQYQQMRSNTMVHVCWHRNCSIGSNEYRAAFSTCLSGYLLRKFKNSSGWQKLWVVFTNFCLFFYKSHQEEFPLASLPLLSYKLSLPLEEDNVNKSNVFKLYFKTHIYYFRAESEYSFVRWMDAIRTASVQ